MIEILRFARLHTKEYLAKAQAIRTITYKKPHKVVTNSPVVRWVKSLLKDAGIDIGTFFSPHSSRPAASSYGLSAGLSQRNPQG